MYLVRCGRCLPLLVVVALVALVATPGCTRQHFRKRADKDVEGIITQKNISPDWEVKNWHVYPDPRSRFADNSNPDRPPYPPDDPAARLLSPNPQRPSKKSGVGRIDGTGYIGILEQWDARNRATADAQAYGPAPETEPFQALPTQEAGNSFNPPTPGVSTGVVNKFSSHPPPVVPVESRGTVNKFGPPIPIEREPNAANEPRKLPNLQAAYTPPLPSQRVGPGLNTIGSVVRLDAPTKRQAVVGTPLTQPVARIVPVPQVTARSALGEFGRRTTTTQPQAPVSVVAGYRFGPTVRKVRPPVLLVGGEVEADGKTHPAIALLPVKARAQAPYMLPEIPIVPQLEEAKQRANQPNQPNQLPQMLPDDPAANYLRALESGEVGYRIKMDQSVEFGLFNAREFQDRREDLYLAALPVTLERFNFAAQAFFTEDIIRRSTGRELANGGEAWNLNTNTGFSKLFPTGASLLVQLANRVVIDLSGDNPQTSISNLTLTLAQPFLRGGGYAVTLEPLALTERNLLYAMRSYARFRKIFYVAIAAGGDYTNNPYGLQGLAPNLGRGVGNNLTAPNIGYLQLLLQQAQINNQRKNVAALERLLRLYQAFREGGQQSPLQVGQVEVQLLNSRGNLLGSGAPNSSSGIRGYLDGLDSFKLQLGLPMTVPLELDDEPLQPVREQLARFDELFAQARVLELEGAKYSRAEPVADFRKRWLEIFTTSPLVRGTAFAKNIEARWAEWGRGKLTDDQLRARLSELRAERRKLLDERVDRELKKQPEPPAEVQRLVKLTSDIELGEFEVAVRAYEAQPWAKKQGQERDSLQDSLFNTAFNAFFLVMLEAQNERLAKLYESWPTLLPLPVEGINVLQSSLDDAYTAAIQAALTNRLDLMNARAQVVDVWRSIAVTANSLQGVFDVRYDLNSATPPGRNAPFAFSADRSTHTLTFHAELPLIRRAERNNYRAALVAYQRQRRTLMAFEDNIANDVRRGLRQLRTLAELYRIQQRAVELGYAQVDNAEAVLFAPPAPGAGSDAGSAAALTQQVLTAQSNLVQAQNNLYTIWVQYLTARMNLYLDLEQMPLDDRGVWSDEFFNRTDRQNRPDAQPGNERPAERLHAPQLVPAPGPNAGR